MKSDQWDGIYTVLPRIEGAPNFRRILNTCLFGVGQPSEISLATIVSTLLKEYQFVTWINLREEPLVYANGTSFAPRDADTLNINLEHLLGIEGFDLEQMEQRLKADMKRISQEQGNKFKFYFQCEDMTNEVREIEIHGDTIITPRELFNGVTADNDYPMEYYRIPITDECAPEEKDFDQLVATFKALPEKSAVVFNCQMGRGRTTTGLVCAYLLKYTHQIHNRAVVAPTYDLPDGKNPNYMKGEWMVILKLVSILENGHVVKKQVDEAIDICSQVQNLRTTIVECREKCISGGTDANKWFKRGQNYLERYWWLILFNAYCVEQAPLGYKMNFTHWMNCRWGLRRLLKKVELS